MMIPCSGVDFNTLERDKAAGGGQEGRLGSVHTPADRLVTCVNDFFELFVSAWLISRDGRQAVAAKGCSFHGAAVVVRRPAKARPCVSPQPHELLTPARPTPFPCHQGLGNPLFALFFLFPACEALVKWVANALPTRNFKRVRESGGRGGVGLECSIRLPEEACTVSRCAAAARCCSRFQGGQFTHCVLCPPFLPLQEIAARRQLRLVGTELVQQARAASAAAQDGTNGSTGGAAHMGAGPAAAPSKQRGEARPGSFLSLVLPFVGRPVGDTGTRLDELWAATQAAGFILAGAHSMAALA